MTSVQSNPVSRVVTFLSYNFYCSYFDELKPLGQLSMYVRACKILNKISCTYPTGKYESNA